MVFFPSWISWIPKGCQAESLVCRKNPQALQHPLVDLPHSARDMLIASVLEGSPERLGWELVRPPK